MTSIIDGIINRDACSMFVGWKMNASMLVKTTLIIELTCMVMQIEEWTWNSLIFMQRPILQSDEKGST